MSDARVAAVPAYNAEKTVGALVLGLAAGFDEVWVLDDGSTDGTGDAARGAGARVVRHATNLGKGRALRSLFQIADRERVSTLVTVDADGQHPAEEAVRLDRLEPDQDALVLGVRDLVAAIAPSANQTGNRISNFWISLFARRRFRDTNCGLRRYPVRATCALGIGADRFAFEAEAVLRAELAGIRIVEHPVTVLYPADRTTHFHVVKDPARIVGRVVATLVERQLRRP